MKLLESFHTHTYRCGHADGTEREYVEQAVKAGMTKLGFSDHTPYIFEGDYYSTFRMRPEQLDGYFSVLTELKDEFSDRIEMHIGLEAEYYPKYFEKLLKFIEPYPVEYLLLGQHVLGNEIGESGSGWRTEDPERLKRYVAQVCEAMTTGKFNCFAHPDLLWYEGDDSLYEREMLKLCEQAKKYAIPLEINLLGMRSGRNYPDNRFWKIAAAVGNDVVCGSDAHSAIDVQDQASYDKALVMADELGLKLHPASIILNGGYKSK